MNIVITRSAADDIAEAYLFYEQQLEGLGGYFEAAIFADIRSLAIYPGIHEIHFGTYFRKVASKFPYAIYYTLEANVIQVSAVADTRRNPVSIEKRLD